VYGGVPSEVAGTACFSPRLIWFSFSRMLITGRLESVHG